MTDSMLSAQLLLATPASHPFALPHPDIPVVDQAKMAGVIQGSNESPGQRPALVQVTQSCCATQHPTSQPVNMPFQGIYAAKGDVTLVLTPCLVWNAP
jgi:hypothetical protein